MKGGMDLDKQNKGKNSVKCAQDLMLFVETIIKDLTENEILCSEGGYFVLKKKF
jgi:hypothetical protein